MKHTYLLPALCLALSPLAVWSQTGAWQAVNPNHLPAEPDARTFEYARSPQFFHQAADALRARLLTDQAITTTLPLPTGERVSVQLRPDPILSPGLAAKYPEVRTFRVLPNRLVRGGRVGWTYHGLHATLRTAEGIVYIDPYFNTRQDYYTAYYAHDADETLNPGFSCGNEIQPIDLGELYPEPTGQDFQALTTLGDPVMMHGYRLAVAATGEFTNFHGGTVEDALSAIVTIINRLNEVLEVDLAVRFDLVEDTDKVIYTDFQTDPYPFGEPGDLWDINNDILFDSIGAANFDVGHLFDTGPGSGGGIGFIGSVCGPNRGQAVSSRGAPQGDPFTINIVAHEFGHQMGGLHTMSNCQNVQPQTAYEPGSGSTIMAYTGICPPGNNLQTNSDPYYHTNSLQLIFGFMHGDNGAACATMEDIGNTRPDVTAPYQDSFYIPISTPFELTAQATDTEDVGLTYCWEQYDVNEGDQTPPGMPTGSSPTFRSWPPVSSPTRVFPRLDRIINNQSANDEVLPTYSRTLTFRCTVRDNHPGGGGFGYDQVRFFATAAAGPFEVQSPNASGDTWTVGQYREVTWDVANTDAAPVNCEFVNVKLSTDGGFTYPITLLENAPNTGSAFVTVPDAVTTDARVRVEAANSIFFDISNFDFTIEPATAPGFTLDFAPLYQEICTPTEASFTFNSAAILDYDSAVALTVVSELPEGVIATLLPDTIQPGQSSQLMLDLNNTLFDGPLAITVRAVAPGLDTAFRDLSLEVFNSDFSDLALLAPDNGQTGIVLTADFSWTDLPNALAYDWQLSSEPTFTDGLLTSAMDLDTNGIRPSQFFENNTLYFWRVRPRNECGTGDWSSPRVFQTVNAICEVAEPDDVPITIPGTGPLPTVTSTLNVPFAGAISDLNIPYLNVSYQPIQNFRISVNSPSGTEVLLYDGNCFGTDQVAIGFDDDAPNVITCPPDDGVVFQPVGSLSNFIGEDALGNWQLKVQVLESGFGAPGQIANWSLEFCATATPEIPALLKNDTLFVPPAQANPVTDEQLQITSTVATPSQLVYTLITPPANGQLLFLDQVLQVGDQFTQASIDAFNVFYLHDGSDTEYDTFDFIVEDGEGGFVPVTTFNIRIDEDAVVNTQEPAEALDFRLFPNPTQARITLQMGQAPPRDLPLQLFNWQGQLLRQWTLPKGAHRWELSLEELPAGIYALRIGEQVRKVIRL